MQLLSLTSKYEALSSSPAFRAGCCLCTSPKGKLQVTDYLCCLSTVLTLKAASNELLHAGYLPQKNILCMLDLHTSISGSKQLFILTTENFSSVFTFGEHSINQGWCKVVAECLLFMSICA